MRRVSVVFAAVSVCAACSGKSDEPSPAPPEKEAAAESSVSPTHETADPSELPTRSGAFAVTPKPDDLGPTTIHVKEDGLTLDTEVIVPMTAGTFDVEIGDDGIIEPLRERFEPKDDALATGNPLVVKAYDMFVFAHLRLVFDTAIAAGFTKFAIVGERDGARAVEVSPPGFRTPGAPGIEARTPHLSVEVDHDGLSWKTHPGGQISAVIKGDDLTALSEAAVNFQAASPDADTVVVSGRRHTSTGRLIAAIDAVQGAKCDQSSPTTCRFARVVLHHQGAHYYAGSEGRDTKASTK